VTRKPVKGGIQTSFTGDDVTECLGGSDRLTRPPRTRYESCANGGSTDMQLPDGRLVAEELGALARFGGTTCARS
jgi:3-deoxy-D-arabino-heptulosonate 7-phosphate (DAHP) synthase class II